MEQVLVKIFESFVDPGGQMRIAAAFVSMRIAAAFVLIAPALATVEVRDAGEMGLGVFATSAIAADTVLGFYEGEIIEGERLAECTEPEGAPDPCCFYRVQLDATRVIDGACLLRMIRANDNDVAAAMDQLRAILSYRQKYEIDDLDG